MRSRFRETWNVLKVRQRKPEIIQAKTTICKLDLKMAQSPAESQLKNVGNLIFHQLGMPVVTFKCSLMDFVRLRCLIVSNYTWEKELPRFSRRLWLQRRYHLVLQVNRQEQCNYQVHVLRNADFCWTLIAHMVGEQFC